MSNHVNGKDYLPLSASSVSQGRNLRTVLLNLSNVTET